MPGPICCVIPQPKPSTREQLNRFPAMEVQFVKGFIQEEADKTHPTQWCAHMAALRELGHPGVTEANRLAEIRRLLLEAKEKPRMVAPEILDAAYGVHSQPTSSLLNDGDDR